MMDVSREVVSDRSLNIANLHHTVEGALANKEWSLVRDAGRSVLEETPEHAEALFALALVSVQEQDLAAAVALAERACASDPDVQEYVDLLAVVHGLAGDLNTSVYYAKLAITLQPRPHLRAWMAASLPSYVAVLQAIEEKPLLRRAGAAMASENWAGAEFWLRQHLAFEPESREAYLALGGCLMAAASPRAAVAALRAGQQQLASDPDIASLLGKALAALGRFEEAEACHRWARAQRPDDAAIAAAPLVQKLFDFRAGTDETVASFRDWGRRFGLRQGGAADARVVAADGPLTIGYLIAGGRASTEMRALSEILACRDPRRFATVGFGYGSLDAPVNVPFQKAVDRWQAVPTGDPLTLSAMVRAEGVDILVNLAGFSAPELLVAFGTRMAPCQVAWLDSPAGTGLTAMDFLLTDGFVDPDRWGGGRYTEWLAYLDLGCVVAVPPSSADAGDRSTETMGVAFAADATLRELNPATVECWARVLHAVPGSTLTLRDHDFRDPDNLADLIGLFGDFGLAHRVDVLSERSPATFFRAADVCLLPMPFPTPETAMNALSAGIPAICPAGSGRHTRLAASLLHHLDLDEPMIAECHDDYVALAVAWAVDTQRREAFRASIRERLPRARALDPKARARDLESVYEEMWRASVDRSPASNRSSAPAA
ncbi:MAG: CDC27 family protein [Rhodospirillales bacterium]